MSAPTTSSSSGDPSSHSSSSQSQSQSVPSTLDTASTQDVVDGMDDVEQEHNMPQPWGRLYPIGKGFKLVVTLFSGVQAKIWLGRTTRPAPAGKLFQPLHMGASPLQVVVSELFEDDYSFGRGSMNKMQFEVKDFQNNPHYQALSTKHYRLYREKNNKASYDTFLTDLSSNGTFLNGEKIGRNQTHVLHNNDEISLSVIKNKAYIFQELGKASEGLENLPEAFKAKYTLSKTIGRGACGEVKLCFTKGNCSRYAVKIISKKQFSVSVQEASTRDEVEILKALDHPTIIRIQDVFETPDNIYIVLELVEGGELFDRIKNQRRMEEKCVKLIFYQMLISVKYLHDGGITHRDLKPENVLLASDNDETLIKITDFGLSKMVGEQSLMKTLCGTPSYLAPEVLTSSGVGGYSKAVDCWSLGVMLFVCLAGYPPFSEEIKPYTLTQQICKGLYKFHKAYWDPISDEAKDLVKKLLTVNPSERITVEGALEHPWLQDEEVISKAKKIMFPSGEDSMLPPQPRASKKRKLSD